MGTTFDFELGDNSEEVLREKEQAIIRFLVEAGLHLEGQAKKELENHPRRIDTGTLRNSISNVVEGSEAVYVGTNVEYGIYVHEGTRRMEANRFLTNAFQRNIGQLERKLREALEGD